MSAPKILLRPDLHFRHIDQDFVFLDLAAERYFLLQGEPAAYFGRFLAGNARAAEIAWLVERRILCGGEEGAFLPTADIPKPRSSLIDDRLSKASVLAAAASVWAQTRAQRDLGRRPLREILIEVTIANRRADKSEPLICSEMAAAFLRARHYVPAIDKCLARALAMKRMLSRRRCAATLVFGVTMPFSAHCWVQAGEVVLTDPLDIILPFKPILAV